MQGRYSLFVTMVAGQLAIWPAVSSARAAQIEIKTGRASVNLELGAGTTLNIARPFSFVLIDDPRVIDFQALGERSLLLRPLGLGSSNLVIVDKRGIVITNVTIVVRSAGAI